MVTIPPKWRNGSGRTGGDDGRSRPTSTTGDLPSSFGPGRATPARLAGRCWLLTGKGCGLSGDERPWGVAGEKLFAVVGPPGVGEAEADQHCHDASEAEGSNRTPQGDVGDQAVPVGLEKQTSKRRALEDRLDLGLCGRVGRRTLGQGHRRRLSSE